MSLLVDKYTLGIPGLDGRFSCIFSKLDEKKKNYEILEWRFIQQRTKTSGRLQMYCFKSSIQLSEIYAVQDIAFLSIS